MEACVAAAARQLRPVDAGNPRAARRRILAPVFCLNAGAERGEERRGASGRGKDLGEFRPDADSEAIAGMINEGTLAPGASGVCPAQCGLLARDHRTAIAGNWPGGIVSAESSDAFPGFVRIGSDRVAT